MSRSICLVLLCIVACTPDGDGDAGDGGVDSAKAADACPVAVWDPPSLVWTNLAAGAPAPQTLTVLNDCAGESPLSLEATVNRDEFSLASGLASAGPAEVASFVVTANLSDHGETLGTLTIATNDPATPTITVALTATLHPDQDGDGVSYETDCDDFDDAVNPTADEVWYDGLDQNCDGNDDDQDEDGDAVGVDCDDTDPTRGPSSEEVWYDGVDQDCDGNDDDQDGDGVLSDVDCDDTDAGVYPGADEVWYDDVDQDCDGNDDDQDGDGYDEGLDDCDDADAAVYPAAPDAFYDGVDSDCLGDSDWDADRDGYDSEGGGGEDCDDTDAAVSPDATEVWYDGVDGDCDGGSDYDQDGDGASAFVYGGSDCADTDASTTAGVDETRNGLDDNCDGSIDEGLVAAGDVLVTEIMANPLAVSDSAGEWIELYNANAYDIDLIGWIVYSDDGGSVTISSSLIVPAGGYAVLGVEDDTSLNGGVNVDYVYNRVDFGLADTDSIFLVAGTTTVFELSFDATWGVTEGASLSLDPDQYDVSTVATSWCDGLEAWGSATDLGSPGEANAPCPSLDHDGDAMSPDAGDCDDDDATIYLDAPEAVNGVDDDCDGFVDEPDIDVSTLPYLKGAATSALVSTWGVGDMDGDADADLLLMASGTTAGDGFWIVDGAGYAGFSGTVDSYAVATIDPGTPNRRLASRWLGDNTGDGLVDVVFTYDETGSTDLAHWYLYSEPTGAETASGAEIVCTGTTAPTSNGSIFSDADFNGDGVAEVVYSNHSEGSSYSGGGRVDVFDVSTAGSALTLGDADLTLTAESTYQYLGSYTAAGDVDADGYLDLVVSDGTSSTVGNVWVIPGDGLASPKSGTASSFATLVLDEASWDNELVVQDFDGDGGADVFSLGNRIYADLGGLSGTLTAADATTDFTAGASACWRYDARVDFDEDGLYDIPLYCHVEYNSDYTTEYWKLLFGGPNALDEPTADETDGFLEILVENASEDPYIRHEFDLDGDGDDEHVITDGGGSSEGYTYFWGR